jgi:prepilin-type N-terminal cleavage/methylation domain-containing protein
VIKNRGGFSLIEMLIAASLLVLTALVAAQLFSVARISTRTVEATLEKTNIISAIRQIIRYNNTCTQALSNGLNTAGFNSAAITSGNRQIQIRIPGIFHDGNPNDDVVGAGTRVQRVDVESLKLVNGFDIGANKFVAQIQLTVKDSMTTRSMRPVEVGSLYFVTNGSGFVACENDTTNSSPLCIELGCTWDPSATPSCQCPTTIVTCPPQQFLTGVDGTGTPICTPLGNGQCPAGTYLRGISIGANDCVPLPP